MERVIRIVVDSRGAQDGARTVTSELDRVKGSARETDGVLRGMGKTISMVGAALAGFAGAAMVRSLIQTASTFQQLRVQLETVEGSANKAARSFAMIREFALRTPFEVKNLTESFINLRGVGIKPTEEMLTAFSDIASARSRDITEFTQAAVSAAFGNTMALRQFGILASAEGDKMKITFNGMTQTVNREANSIIHALMKIGQVNFGDSANRQSQTFAGAVSNMEDAIADLQDKIGQAGLLDVLTKGVLAASSAIETFGNHLETAGRVLGTAVTAFLSYKATVIGVTAAQAVLNSGLMFAAVSAIQGNLVPAALAAGRAMNVLTAAIAANPIGLFATAVSVAASALFLFTRSNVEADASIRRLNDALGVAKLETFDLAKEREKLRKETEKLNEAEKNLAQIQLQNAIRGETKKLERARGGLLDDLPVDAFGRLGQDANRASEELRNAFKKGEISAGELLLGLQKVGLGGAALDALAERASEFDLLAKAISHAKEQLDKLKSGVSAVGDGADTPKPPISEDELAKIAKAYDAVRAALDPAIERQLKYNEAVAALDDAKVQGLVSKEEYARLKELAGGILTKPFDDIVKKLNEENQALQNLIAGRQEISKEAEIQRALDEASVKLTEEQRKNLEGVVATNKDLTDQYAKQQVAKDLDAEIDRLTLILQGREDEIIFLEIKNKLLKDGIALSSEEEATLREKLNRITELNKQIDAQRERAAEIEQIYRNAAENIQRSFADTFRGIFDKGIKSFKDLGKAVLNIFKDLAAQLLAAKLFGGLTADVKLAVQGGGVGGAAGGLLNGLGNMLGFGGNNSLFGDGGIIDKIGSKLGFAQNKLSADVAKSVLGKTGLSTQTLGTVFGNAATGALIGGLTNALGLKGSSAGGAIGGAIGSFVPIPGGNIIGSVIGSLIGGVLKKTPRSQTAIGSGTVFTRGKADASTGAAMGDQVYGTLQELAAALGGKISDSAALGVIGQRGKEFFFDPRSGLKDKQYGDPKQYRYATAEEAVEAAIKNALSKGVITGINETIDRALKSGRPTEEIISFAQAFREIEYAAKAANDNVGASLEMLNEKFTALKDQFISFGADLTNLETVYQKERQAIIENGNNGALKSFKDFLFDLEGGTSSPLSAASRAATARESLDQVAAKIRAGESVDFNAFQTSAQALLDAQRERFGSTPQFFETFNEIRELTKLAIANASKVTALPDPIDFTAPIQKSVDNQTGVLINLNTQLGTKLDAIRQVLQAGQNPAAVVNGLNPYGMTWIGSF